LLFYGALFCALTFFLARCLGSSRWSASCASLLLLLCSLPARFLALHNWDSTAAALVSLYCGVRLLQKPSHRLAVLIGFFTALAILFDQARGMGLLLGLVAGLSVTRLYIGSPRLAAVLFLTMAASF